MNIIVCSNGIDSIIRSQVRPSNGQVIDFNIKCKIEDKVELGAVNQQQIVDCSIDRGDQSQHSRSIRTRKSAPEIGSMDGNLLPRNAVEVSLTLYCSKTILRIELKIDSYIQISKSWSRQGGKFLPLIITIKFCKNSPSPSPLIVLFRTWAPANPCNINSLGTA